MPEKNLFDVERDGEILIVTPSSDLRESAYQDIETGARGILDLLTTGQIKGVVLDFSRTDYYGSTALGMFVRIWKRISGYGGKMAFCNVSIHEKDVLEATRLHTLWPICATKEEALKFVGKTD